MNNQPPNQKRSERSQLWWKNLDYMPTLVQFQRPRVSWHHRDTELILASENFKNIQTYHCPTYIGYMPRPNNTFSNTRLG